MRVVSRRMFAAPAALALLLGCSSHTAPVLNYPNVPIVLASGKMMSAEAVHDATLLAARQKGWTTSEIQPGIIDATLSVREHVAVVAISYSPTSYGITYKHSTNLRYADGKIHGNYNRWIKNLKRQIDRQIRIVAAARHE